MVTLKTLEPFTTKEIKVLAKAINTFSTGGHRQSDKSSIGGFSKSWVAGLLKKSEKMLSKMPEHKGDLATVKKLLKKFNQKSKI